LGVPAARQGKPRRRYGLNDSPLACPDVTVWRYGADAADLQACDPGASLLILEVTQGKSAVAPATYSILWVPLLTGFAEVVGEQQFLVDDDCGAGALCGGRGTGAFIAAENPSSATSGSTYGCAG
jgi:hypothetical protein